MKKANGVQTWCMLHALAFVLLAFLFVPVARVAATGCGGKTAGTLGFRLMPLVAYQENGNDGL